ncbi:DUF91 domain-containing protein [Bacillaceae bacterium S4-13-56]
MTLNMNLWKVKGNQLEEVSKTRLNSEDRLESWIAKDSSIMGLDILIFGRQVVTSFGGRIDLLAMDIEGNLIILELKKDKTPRDIVAQALDYASWVKDLSYKEVRDIAVNYLKSDLQQAFYNKFQSHLPEEINKSHSIVIVASELDQSSERIVQYLSSEYDININCIFFDFFKEGSNEWLGRSWLMDPEEISERAGDRKKSPWTGIYFVNIGDEHWRSWDDCKKYGFLSAGQGIRYIKQIKKLNIGDRILAYLKGKGYVGYGVVTANAVMGKDFQLEDGTFLFDSPLEQTNIKEDKDNPDKADWIVGIDWKKAFDRENAVTKPGIFANQNIVCKLRNEDSLEFLEKHFPLGEE